MMMDYISSRSITRTMVLHPLPLPRVQSSTPHRRIQPTRHGRLCTCASSKCFTVLVAEENEDVLLKQEEDGKEGRPEAVPSSPERVDYNWEDQWYPLYLTRELPRDAPLGLTVFHKQVVLHYDGHGNLRCYEDRCAHRLAKLSEGQIMNGRLECLYHGWQFEGEGQCVKIPQLPEGAKIPSAACVRSYPVHDSQGVIWVWMGTKNKADVKTIPHFDQYDDPNNVEFASVHFLPYDHSILLENLMDPAHIPISHDRTDLSAKRENAQALKFEIFERTSRGFAGRWGDLASEDFAFNSRFEAPCVLRNEREKLDKDGNLIRFTAVFLCRPAGQGQSMLIARFAQEMPVVEAAPAGFIAAKASSPAMKGANATPFAPNLTNRYFRHVVHCSKCRGAFQNLKSGQKLFTVLAVLSFSLGVLISRTPWRVASVGVGILAIAGLYTCQLGINMLTTNELRPHRK
ncbi:hypothetical protein GOP47_0012769 [Adiantum capillus-veneris]|uniref:Rieske domain-containing protein n=1 Tax=Adiantum capillus-veneris TaxID=13818 RepID=A0A9D4USP8_ADICA|nr:hypothetical protein GOP47_0012769 [Adiantum capillus-veneris]